MLNCNHFELRQRLSHKALEFGAVVHAVSEHYMSKTYDKCGRIHCGLGGSKIFVCPYCHFTINRDFNGTRNILLMNIENPYSKW